MNFLMSRFYGFFNLLNGAVDVINDLQTTVAKQASAIDTLNSKNIGKIYHKYGNVIAKKNTYVEICQVSVPAGVYIICAIVGINIADPNNIMSLNISLFDNATGQKITEQIARTTSSSGGGCSTTIAVNLDNSASVVLLSYGYISDKSYNFTGDLWAVKLG